jgi:acyl phosphate:glycerol-3-phosphate acyltransferase
LLSGFVSLATMLSTVALAVFVLLLQPSDVPLCAFCAGIAVFVIFTHRSNIARMRAGKENRVRRLWLFRSRAA